jgi:hypothetical protein
MLVGAVSGRRGENDTKLTDIGMLETIRATEEIFQYNALKP